MEGFLGLTTNNWISIGLAVVFVLVSYTVVPRIIRRLLRRIARRTESTLDDALLEAIQPQIRWLVLAVSFQISVSWLGFLGVRALETLQTIYQLLYVFVFTAAAWRLIDATVNWYGDQIDVSDRQDAWERILPIAKRVGQIIVVSLSFLTVLTLFGVNITALLAGLGIGGLALSLAAQDTLADAVAGFAIILDRPFLVGDRIDLPSQNTWGDVVEIGLRSTKIRTRDNRLVIVPNGSIARSEIVNYTYPDPVYRVQTHVTLTYDTDLEFARGVIIEAVRGVEGVLQDRPVEALYIEMADSYMKIRVRWWIESYVDTRRMFDYVHTALQQALDEAGIKDAYPVLSLKSEVVGQLAQISGPESSDSTDADQSSS